MEKRISGLHHVTAIADDPQANVDFYTGVLGLRLVKLTVNFDDPGSYHLYYGDELGRPGSILTFFAWPGGFRGRRGAGQATSVGFSVPSASLGYWQERLRGHGVKQEAPVARFREEALAAYDPDGMRFELVADDTADDRAPWADGPVPSTHGIRGLHGVTLTEERYERTAGFVDGVLGFRPAGDATDRFRFAAGEGGHGTLVDVVCEAGARPGAVAVGTIHHVAWRTPNDPEQEDWRRELTAGGNIVSPVMDRVYFHSIYFREPGGVLFEVATDEPGFVADEPAAELGQSLKLPPWLEASRGQIEARLPALRLAQRAAA